MKAVLFHKNEKVLSVDYEPKTAKFGKVLRLFSEERVPVGIRGIPGLDLSSALQFWWNSRLIPKNRSGFKNIPPEISALASESFGFNLSDQYWIKPEGANVTWEKGNFYTNSFNEEIGKHLVGVKSGPFERMSSNSPDWFSNGEQDKRWVTVRGVKKLLKYGRPPYHEQPFNEALASEICRRLGFAHVGYSAVIKGSSAPEVYSSCPCFVDENTEFVPAGLVQYAAKTQKGVSVYKHLLECCKALGMGGMEAVEKSIAETALLDYIMANVDRHFGNFGFIRDANTLQWKGAAPIFDTGNAMFYEYPTSDLRKSRSLMENVKCRSFAPTQRKLLERLCEEVLGLGVDFSKLDGIEAFYENILSRNPKVDDERRSLLSHLLSERIASAKEIIYSRNSVAMLFLMDVANIKDKDFLSGVKKTRERYRSMGEKEKKAVDNYILSLRPSDEKELENLIKKDAARALKKSRSAAKNSPSRSD